MWVAAVVEVAVGVEVVVAAPVGVVADVGGVEAVGSCEPGVVVVALVAHTGLTLTGGGGEGSSGHSHACSGGRSSGGLTIR